MPEIGEIKTARNIWPNKSWKRLQSGHAKYIWQACKNCGKKRWVQFRKGHPVSQQCLYCGLKQRRSFQGSANPSWKGGRVKKYGYIYVRLSKDDFFYRMANSDGYVREHRLIVAKQLGRCLQDWEIVHHRNGVKDDNRFENLQLVQEMQHRQITILECKINKLLKKQEELQIQNRLLQWQLKEHLSREAKCQ